jgi:hypothetical protein
MQSQVRRRQLACPLLLVGEHLSILLRHRQQGHGHTFVKTFSVQAVQKLCIAIFTADNSELYRGRPKYPRTNFDQTARARLEAEAARTSQSLAFNTKIRYGTDMNNLFRARTENRRAYCGIRQKYCTWSTRDRDVNRVMPTLVLPTGTRSSSADALDNCYPLAIAWLNERRSSTSLCACDNLH